MVQIWFVYLTKSLIIKYIKWQIVGMTGFEPATTRPPDVYATGLRYIPMLQKYRILKLL